MSKINKFTAAAIQMVSTTNLEQNLLTAKKLIAQAATAGASIVVLPENFALLGCANSYQYGLNEESATPPIQQFLKSQALEHHVWLVGGTIPRNQGLNSNPNAASPRAYASSHIYSPKGEEIGRYDKIHLFDAAVNDTVGSYKESDSFMPGTDLGLVNTDLGVLGVSVCYDLRFPEYFRLLQQQGMTFLAVPSAFTYSTGVAHWEVLLRSRAIENQCFVIAANQGGWHNEKRRTYGHSCIVDPWGTVLNVLPSGEGVVLAEINMENLIELRQRMPVLKHRKF